MRAGKRAYAILASFVSSGVLASVFGHWRDVVGEQVADHAHPLSLVDGTLAIGVEDPAWRTQLTFLEQELLARIASFLGPGQVRAVEVRVRRPRPR